MPGKRRDDDRTGEAPRTDLPPEREPYDDGYFGTGEEEGVERERDAEEVEKEQRRGAAEDAAGGDREII
jgi:hypothetical protein